MLGWGIVFFAALRSAARTEVIYLFAATAAGAAVDLELVWWTRDLPFKWPVRVSLLTECFFFVPTYLLGICEANKKRILGHHLP